MTRGESVLSITHDGWHTLETDAVKTNGAPITAYSFHAESNDGMRTAYQNDPKSAVIAIMYFLHLTTSMPMGCTQWRNVSNCNVFPARYDYIGVLLIQCNDYKIRYLMKKSIFRCINSVLKVIAIVLY